MKIRVLMITHDRPEYTRRSLSALCESMPAEGAVVVWDNDSGEETRAVLAEFESDPRIDRIVYHSSNDKLRIPTNWFWGEFDDADYLGKVDDDCIVPDNWCDELIKAHEDIPKAGAIACWHFPPEDFDEKLAEQKIVSHGSHRLLRNCWINGSGYLMKRSMWKSLGPLREQESFTGYCLRGASEHGLIFGWYYPFLYQAHLDDPRIEASGIQSENDFLANIPLSAQTFSVKSRQEWIERLKYSANMLQRCSYDPRDWVGLRAKLLRRAYQLVGKKYVPSVRRSGD